MLGRLRTVTGLVASAAFLLVVPSIALASPCIPGTLDDYLSVTSCTYGGLTFSDFLLLPGSSFATLIDPSTIQVLPASGGGQAGFQFLVNDDASPDEEREAKFQYLVSGGFVNGAQLTMTGATASVDGAVTTVKELCLGDAFLFGTGTCFSAPQQTLIVFAIDGLEELTASATFGAIDTIGVIDDLVIDGGLFGSASLAGSFSNMFNVTAPTTPAPIPEPATGLLLTAGLAAVLRRCRRTQP